VITQQLGDWIKGWLKAAQDACKQRIYCWKTIQKKHVQSSKQPMHSKPNLLRQVIKWHVQDATQLMELQAFTANGIETDQSNPDDAISFDSDTRRVKVNNCASRCLSHDIDDFEGPMHPCDKKLAPITGTDVKGLMLGTIKWTIEDDQGKQHVLCYPTQSICQVQGIASCLPNIGHRWSRITSLSREEHMVCHI
jgi:hypothetical protein